MRFLNSSVSAIPAARWARWPYQETYKAKLDSTQRLMISTLMKWKPASDESFDDFSMRRRIMANRIARKYGKWSTCWAKSLQTWSEHVHRGNDPGAWSVHLLNYHDSEWLDVQRLLFSDLGESRTNTRSGRFKVHRRWHEGFQRALLVC